MMKTKLTNLTLAFAVGLVLSGIASARADEQVSLAQTNTETAAGSGAGVDKADKTGTNPLNFQRTFQVVNEFDGLGHAQLNYTRFRYTEPFADGKVSLRLEVPLVYAHAAFASSSADGSDGGGGAPISDDGSISEYGLGDIGLKLSYVPYVTPSGGVLTSLELDGPTASKDALGTGKFVIAPSVAYGFFLPGNHVFAPAYKQSNSFAGDHSRADINSGKLDFYFVSKFDKGRQWVTIDPTYIMNYQAGKYAGATIRVVYGRVLGKIGGAVVSGYIEPGVGIGSDRPNDWSLEVGASLIGF